MSHVHTRDCLVYFDSQHRPTRTVAFASVAIGCAYARSEERRLMVDEEARYEHQERLRSLDRPITTKRWHRLKAVWIPDRERFGFIIDEPRPRGDDRRQYDSPHFIIVANQSFLREGTPAVGRYWSDITGGRWEVWANSRYGIPTCITYDRACIESGPRACQRMIGGVL